MNDGTGQVEWRVWSPHNSRAGRGGAGSAAGTVPSASCWAFSPEAEHSRLSFVPAVLLLGLFPAGLTEYVPQGLSHYLYQPQTRNDPNAISSGKDE